MAISTISSTDQLTMGCFNRFCVYTVHMNPQRYLMQSSFSMPMENFCLSVSCGSGTVLAAAVERGGVCRQGAEIKRRCLWAREIKSDPRRFSTGLDCFHCLPANMLMLFPIRYVEEMGSYGWKKQLTHSNKSIFSSSNIFIVYV